MVEAGATGGGPRAAATRMVDDPAVRVAIRTNHQIAMMVRAERRAGVRGALARGEPS